MHRAIELSGPDAGRARRRVDPRISDSATSSSIWANSMRFTERMARAERALVMGIFEDGLDRNGARDEHAMSMEDVIMQSHGMQQWTRLQKCLQMVLDVRSEDQIHFHDALSRNILHWVFSREWQSGSSEIKRLTGMQSHNKDTLGVIARMPRQFGKTTCVAAFMASCMVSLSGVDILVAATTMEIAEQLMSRALNMCGRLCKIMGISTRVQVRNKQKIVISGWSGNTRFVTVTCVPQSITVRGRSPDIIIIDEFGFMGSEFVMTKIYPMLAVPGRKLFAMTSPAGGIGSVVEQCLNARDPVTGNPSFDTFVVSNVCNICLETGRTSCPHKKRNSPPWRNSIQEERVSRLYPEASAALVQQELLGAHITSGTSVFDEALIRSVFDTSGPYAYTPFQCETNRPSAIYLAMDPSGGGDSEMALVAVFFIPGHGSIASKVAVSVLWDFGELKRAHLSGLYGLVIGIGARFGPIVHHVKGAEWVHPHENADHEIHDKHIMRKWLDPSNLAPVRNRRPGVQRPESLPFVQHPDDVGLVHDHKKVDAPSLASRADAGSVLLGKHNRRNDQKDRRKLVARLRLLNVGHRRAREVVGECLWGLHLLQSGVCLGGLPRIGLAPELRRGSRQSQKICQPVLFIRVAHRHNLTCR